MRPTLHGAEQPTTPVVEEAFRPTLRIGRVGRRADWNGAPLLLAALEVDPLLDAPLGRRLLPRLQRSVRASALGLRQSKVGRRCSRSQSSSLELCSLVRTPCFIASKLSGLQRSLRSMSNNFSASGCHERRHCIRRRSAAWTAGSSSCSLGHSQATGMLLDDLEPQRPHGVLQLWRRALVALDGGLP